MPAKPLGLRGFSAIPAPEWSRRNAGAWHEVDGVVSRAVGACAYQIQFSAPFAIQ